MMIPNAGGGYSKNLQGGFRYYVIEGGNIGHCRIHELNFKSQCAKMSSFSWAVKVVVFTVAIQGELTMTFPVPPATDLLPVALQQVSHVYPAKMPGKQTGCHIVSIAITNHVYITNIIYMLIIFKLKQHDLCSSECLKPIVCSGTDEQRRCLVFGKH